MDELLYQMIFKRKSFHTFKGEQHLTEAELADVAARLSTLTPLLDDIEVAWRILPRRETSCTHGEYCILVYSEKKDGYLYNVGYQFEQLDLWLASQNIGACWYGMGRTEERTHQGLNFVIMMAIEKADENEFRKDYRKAKRKEIFDIWSGIDFPALSPVVRFSPSACNTQPWLVEAEEHKIDIYRVLGARGIMPIDKVPFFNSIDMGIFLLFTELCLKHEQIPFRRQIPLGVPNGIKTHVATYHFDFEQ